MAATLSLWEWVEENGESIRKERLNRGTEKK
jgi:hypothetical protein